MLYKNCELYNIELLIDRAEGKLPSRLPEAVRLKLNAPARQAAFTTGGCEIRFIINSGSAVVKLRRIPLYPTNRTGLGEIFYGGFQAGYHLSPIFVGPEITELIIPQAETGALLQQIQRFSGTGRGFDPCLVRVILPYDDTTYICDVKGDISPPTAEQTPRVKYLAYGSSITHGGSAVRPSETYAMRTAQQLDVDLINLGFPGSAHLDSALAEYIAARTDWDFATLEMGINVIDLWEVDQFQECVTAFVDIIARQNLNKWLFCIDLFTSYHDLVAPEKANAFRQVIQNVVAQFNLPRLVYLNGQELLSDPALLTIDLLHPSARGMEQIAANLTSHIRDFVEIL